MLKPERRYDIDWLRVIAIGLLIIYHIGIAFQPWGVLIGFIQNDKALVSLWAPMSMLNIWRIPLLFFVSGMGVCFAIRKRNWKQLLWERTRRIFLPLLIGMVVIVPIHVILWQIYYNQDISYKPNLGHLWFLANIFTYVILFSPLFFYLKRNENRTIHNFFKALFRSPLGLFLIAGIFLIEAYLVKPGIYETYAFSVHGFLLGMLAFLFGFICIYSGESFWPMIMKWRLQLLIVASSLYLIRLFVFDLQSPDYLKVIESCSWIFAIFGMAYKYLNHPGKILSYLSQAAYPVYILHMGFLFLGSYLLFPLDISAWMKLLAVNLFTFAACFICYEFLIRRISFIRPIFGMKNIQQ